MGIGIVYVDQRVGSLINDEPDVRWLEKHDDRGGNFTKCENARREWANCTGGMQALAH